MSGSDSICEAACSSASFPPTGRSARRGLAARAGCVRSYSVVKEKWAVSRAPRIGVPRRASLKFFVAQSSAPYGPKTRAWGDGRACITRLTDRRSATSHRAAGGTGRDHGVAVPSTAADSGDCRAPGDSVRGGRARRTRARPAGRAGRGALCKKWIGPYLPVRVSIESAYKG